MYSGFALLVEPTAVPPVAPDPDDDVVIGTALAAKADFLVTGDRTLLAVGEYQGTRFVSIHEALELVEALLSRQRG
jgi:hypothetical protein